MSVLKRLSLYEFTLWGRDLLSVVRIIAGFFFRKNRKTMSGHRKLSEIVSVPRGLTVQLIETYQCAIFLNALYIKPNRRKMNEMYKQRNRIKIL